MRKIALFTTVAGLVLSFGAISASAQGPAGAGATTAASSSGSSSHSYNPIKWVKKNKNTDAAPGATSDQNQKLTAKFQADGLLPANTDVNGACSTFKELGDCLAALHASHNTGIDFNCVRADVTGVQTNANISSCKGPLGDKPASLRDALRRQKPEIDAKSEAKTAESQAKADLKDSKS